MIRTFVEAIHIQLAYKRGYIRMFKILTGNYELQLLARDSYTYERTFEKSLDGDMTKLSAEFDQAIRCRMLWSSSMLSNYERCYVHYFQYRTYLYSLWIKAVWTTFGCCAPA